ncbi:MAG TPA: PEP/pyruvate-binding domain-containing protein [Methylomirabilota bacterium]|nr:PEP/pyruvate-binding domain-containing protein [Methylomirabilota bacterium]
MSSFVNRDGGLQELGGKALALLRLGDANLPVPGWFVISPPAFMASLTTEQVEALASGQLRCPGSNLLTYKPADEIEREIGDALRELSAEGGRFAVRSSAVDEDGSQHSFAGQLDTFLFVAADEVCGKVAAVWRSGFSDRIFEYRRQHGLANSPPSAPAVLVQRMVDADASGVAFSADPVSGRRSLAVVSAVPGLGTALVGGEAAADVFKVDRAGRIVEREITRKTISHVFDAAAEEGVSAVTLSEAEGMKPSLTDEQAAAVAKLARNAAQVFGRPQDIEWAIKGDELFLLQSRPITTLLDLADPEGALNLWDNSNITESYNGITTPLTFSFARYVYEGVYRQFCVIMRVPKAKIAANERTFSRMLGLIQGRIYYNLLNWYRVLALLPGFTLNRRFMEQMMGVRESLPNEVVSDLLQASSWDRFVDGLRGMYTIFGLIGNYFILDRQIERFYLHLNEALAPPNPQFADMRLDELVTHYYKLEQQLLSRWDAPLVNDFFAMIFHGAFRKLTAKWCGDTNGMLANDAIRGQGDIISLEPAARVREMAKVAAVHPELAAALREAPVAQAMRAVRQCPEFSALFDAYLEKFGDRCLEELKLESETLHDDPLVLLRNIGEVARGTSAAATPNADVSIADEAEGKMRAELSGSPVRRWTLFWLMRQARKRVRNRENLRFERTRLFGMIRRLFLEAGRRLQSIGRLDDARDIFYVELGEILAFSDGASTTADLRSLAALRKKEFEEYREGPVPADRFETRGPVYHAQTYRSSEPRGTLEAGGEERIGLGCCPGIVRGIARVVRDPKQARLTAGCILVADHTDPGWIMLFPSASGLLVERGSLLSHSAIVARELGIPAVISIPGLLDWLQDGDEVELDGAAGIVRRLAAQENHA